MKIFYGVCAALLFVIFIQQRNSLADPDLYPQFDQREETTIKIEPEFIRVERLVDAIINKQRPSIVDVRIPKEYKQAHIKGSVSIPLGEIRLRLAEIPKDRLVVLY